MKIDLPKISHSNSHPSGEPWSLFQGCHVYPVALPTVLRLSHRLACRFWFPKVSRAWMYYLAASSSKSHSDSLNWRQISPPSEMEAAISIALRSMKKERLSKYAQNISTIFFCHFPSPDPFWFDGKHSVPSTCF